MNKNQILSKIKKLDQTQTWNHNFKIQDGVETQPKVQKSQGKNLIKFNRLNNLFEEIGIKEKRILDLGCNEGFFSIEMYKKGAKEILGIDIDKNRIKKARFIKKILNIREEVLFEIMDIYSKDFKNLKKFDICLCLGFIHRIPDPVSAIFSIGEKSNMIIFEWKALKHGQHNNSFAYFSKKPIDEIDYYGTEYWLLSYDALETILKRIGFIYFHRIDDPNQRRAILVASREKNSIFEKPDKIIFKNKFIILFTHTKSYIKTLFNILVGKLNA